MKITINGNVKSSAIETFLSEAQAKKEKIEKFCKEKKIQELQYKDSELEFEYKEFTKPKPKIETRVKGG